MKCYDCVCGRCRNPVPCLSINPCDAITAKDGAPLCRWCARGNDNQLRAKRRAS